MVSEVNANTKKKRSELIREGLKRESEKQIKELWDSFNDISPTGQEEVS
jgi:hypothetical protein